MLGAGSAVGSIFVLAQAATATAEQVLKEKRLGREVSRWREKKGEGRRATYRREAVGAPSGGAIVVRGRLGRAVAVSLGRERDGFRRSGGEEYTTTKELEGSDEK